jgi:hypothetical protein
MFKCFQSPALPPVVMELLSCITVMLGCALSAQPHCSCGVVGLHCDASPCGPLYNNELTVGRVKAAVALSRRSTGPAAAAAG